MSGKYMGLAHIGIFTADIEKSKSFYIDNFGFKLDGEVKLDKPGNVWSKLAFLNLNGMVIELVEPSDKTKVNTGNNGSVEHLTIKVEGISELVKELKGKGITFETEEPIHIAKILNGVNVIFFRGPNGERLELFEAL